MKWTLLDSDQTRYKFQLSKDDKQLLKTSIDISMGSIRVSDNQQKRVFLLYREGFLKNKIVLRNEYGVALLTVFTENGTDGEIRFNDHIYRFIIDEKKDVLSIYTNDFLNARNNYKLPELKTYTSNKKGVSPAAMLIAISSWHSLNSISSVEQILV